MSSLQRYWTWITGGGAVALLIALYARSAAEERALLCANAYHNADEGSATSSAAFSCAMREMSNRDTSTIFAILAALILCLGLYLGYSARRSKR
jgi:hypothetical protein